MSEKKHLVREAKGIYSHLDQHGQKTYYIRYKHQGQEYWEATDDTLTLAKKALAIRKAEIAQGRFGITKTVKHTFDELYGKYVDYVQTNDQAKSNLSVAKTLNEFFGSKPVSSITVFDIERYKTKRKDQGIALSTINDAYRYAHWGMPETEMGRC
jgi:hypothetical protein